MIFETFDILSVLLLFFDKKEFRTVYLSFPDVVRNFIKTHYKYLIRPWFLTFDKKVFRYCDITYQYFNQPQLISLQYGQLFNNNGLIKKFAKMKINAVINLNVYDESINNEITVVYNLGVVSTIYGYKYFVHQTRSNDENYFKIFYLDDSIFNYFLSLLYNYNDLEIVKICKYYKDTVENYNCLIVDFE